MVSGGVLALALAGYAGWRLAQARHVRSIVRAGVAPLPDTSRWSPALVSVVKQYSFEAQTSDHPAKALGQLARTYQVNGQFKEAELALRALRRAEPENPRWPYYLADLQLKAKVPVEAIALLRTTVELAPDYAPALIELGDALIRQKRFAEAQSVFQSAAIFAPSDPRPGANLAYLDLVDSKTRSALERLDAVLKQHPRFAAGHRLKADVLEKLGQTASAAEERKQERASPPLAIADPWLDELYDYCFDPYRLQMVAASLVRAERFTDAIPYLQRSVNLSPDEPDFRDTLAEACLLAGKLDAARDALEKGVLAIPDSYVLRVRLATVLCRQNRATEALRVVENALQRWPEQAEVQAAHGHALLIAGKPSEAVDAFKEALQRNSGLVEAQLNLGRAYEQLNQPDEAQKCFEQALEIRPTYVEAMIAATGLSIAVGNLANAQRYVSRLMELAPDRPDVRRVCADALHLKANALASKGNMDDAERAYRQAIEIDPSLPLLHAGLGMVYVSTQRLEQALPELQRFAELAPTDLRAYQLLGETQIALGKKSDAEKTYQIALNLAKLADDATAVGQIEMSIRSLR